MKRINHAAVLAIAFVCIAASCAKSQTDPAFQGLDKITYEVSDENIANPERGLYTALEISEATGRGVSTAGMAATRKLGRTLYLLEFHIQNYVSTDIADDYLQTVEKCFQSLREGGAKCILRFCYSNGFSELDKPWDATEPQVLSHIAQLKPILQEYYDVIMVMQAGFIGSWGEWYYTENFIRNPQTDDDYLPRKHVVDALLDALPQSRQIALRTPTFKQKMYGYSLADTITSATAHQPTIKARLGGHNDCYLASSSDQGTYDNSASRLYWGAESAYTIMGGETCATSAFCHCGASDTDSKAHGVLADMTINHFTYLNGGYHQGVIKRWKEEGCFEEIEKRLGYRYSISAAGFSTNPSAGGSFRVLMHINNGGFAPAQNPRDAELVLTDKSGSVLKTWDLESDPRFWMPGQKTVVDQTITLPEGVSGEVKLYLNLPDPCENLHDNPLYSIRLANNNMWDETTGYNLLYTFSL